MAPAPSTTGAAGAYTDDASPATAVVAASAANDNAAAPAPAARTAAAASGQAPAQAATASTATSTATRARRRRPEPARTTPQRHAGTLLRDTASRSADAPAADEGAVALGVRLGYQVIEEQILQGQKLARRLGRKAAQAARTVGGGLGSATGGAGPAPTGAGGSASGGADEGTPAAAPGEVGELIDRVVHLYKDLGTLCLDAVETLARSPALRAGVARIVPGAGAGSGAAAPQHGAAAAVVLDIHSARRTQVTLDLRPAGVHGLPLVHALHATDPALPPLLGARFLVDPALPELVLQLSIADSQPAGTYTGVVVDGVSNLPRGTLSVRVLP